MCLEAEACSVVRVRMHARACVCVCVRAKGRFAAKGEVRKKGMWGWRVSERKGQSGSEAKAKCAAGARVGDN